LQAAPEFITTAIKMVHRINDEGRQLWVLQVTLAVSLIEPAFDAFKHLAGKFFQLHPLAGRRMTPFPVTPNFHQLPKLVLRERIAEAKRHEVRRPCLPPVRKIALVDREGLSGWRPSKPCGAGRFHISGAHISAEVPAVTHGLGSPCYAILSGLKTRTSPGRSRHL